MPLVVRMDIREAFNWIESVFSPGVYKDPIPEAYKTIKDALSEKTDSGRPYWMCTCGWRYDWTVTECPKCGTVNNHYHPNTRNE